MSGSPMDILYLYAHVFCLLVSSLLQKLSKILLTISSLMFLFISLTKNSFALLHLLTPMLWALAFSMPLPGIILYPVVSRTF